MEYRKQFTAERIRDIDVMRKIIAALEAPTNLRLVRAPGYLPRDAAERNTRTVEACSAVYGRKA